MKHTGKLVAFAMTSLVSFSAWSADSSHAPADTIFYGGTVITVNDKEVRTKSWTTWR
jgi:hypothetical protein